MTLPISIQANRNKMLFAMVPLEPCSFTQIRDDKAWTLDGILKKTPLFSDNPVLQTFQFTFCAPYPYWRAAQVTLELAGLTALWRTPFFMSATQKISEFTPDMFKHIENVGSAPMALRAVFYADHEVKMPSLHNANQNTVIRINKTMLPGERFEISTHDADKDEGNAVLFYAVGAEPVNGFRYIAPGSDLDMRIAPGGNILLADAAAGKQNLRCTVLVSGGERHSL